MTIVPRVVFDVGPRQTYLRVSGKELLKFRPHLCQVRDKQNEFRFTVQH